MQRDPSRGVCSQVLCSGHCSSRGLPGGIWGLALSPVSWEEEPTLRVLEVLGPGVKGRAQAGRGEGEVNWGGGHQEACSPEGLTHPINRNPSAQTRSARPTALLSLADQPSEQMLETKATGVRRMEFPGLCHLGGARRAHVTTPETLLCWFPCSPVGGRLRSVTAARRAGPGREAGPPASEVSTPSPFLRGRGSTCPAPDSRPSRRPGPNRARRSRAKGQDSTCASSPRGRAQIPGGKGAPAPAAQTPSRSCCSHGGGTAFVG